MNNRQILAITTGILTLFAGVLAVRLIWPSSEHDSQIVAKPEIRELSGQNNALSGPYTHKNLSIYLIHAKDVLKGPTPLTLEEAMKRKIVIVHETEDVNELAIENTSSKYEVFVQAGDIVKGGQQDRVLAVDLIVPANSGRMPIDSFCVEQGRWEARGSESKSHFDSSSSFASSKQLKVATRVQKSQGDVWNEVAQTQEKLSTATNSNAQSAESNSSLQLTLEKPRVHSDTAKYVKALSAIIEEKNDVIGFVFTLNGEINSAETYGSNALFVKLWPKLLKASAVEAVAESYGNDKQKPRDLGEIQSFLEDSENGPVIENRDVTKRIKMLVIETGILVFLETRDRGVFLHGSYLMK